MRFLTVSETAKRLRVSSETVRQLCDAGLITAVRFSIKPNGHRKIVESSLDDYIEREIAKARPATDAIELRRPQRVHDAPKLEDVFAAIDEIRKRNRKV